LSFEVSGIPKDSKFPLLGVRVSSSHLPQSGVAIELKAIDNLEFKLNNLGNVKNSQNGGHKKVATS